MAKCRVALLQEQDKRKIAEIASANVEDRAAEIIYWNSIKDSKDPAILKLYLKQFPEGVYSGLANYRLVFTREPGERSGKGKYLGAKLQGHFCSR